MQIVGAKRFFMISTLRRLAGIDTAITQASNASINFNATLPITVEVLKNLIARATVLNLVVVRAHNKKP